MASVPVPCPACRSSEADILLNPHEIEAEREWLRSFYDARQAGSEHREDHSEFTQGEATFLLRCRECGTLRRNPQPTPETLSRKYKLDSYGEDTLEALLESQIDFFRSRAKELIPKLAAGARILEVGSFTGGFLIAAGELGWEATGIDIGLETTEFCQRRGLRVRRQEIAEVDGAPPFDGIVVWNTFDQLACPAELLGHARRLLRPHALLVLRVPNGDFERVCLSMRQECDYRERVLASQAYNNFLTFPYLNGYTRTSLERLLQAEGFRTEGSRGDVLVPLATPDTKEWAIEEERQSKRLTLRLCAREQMRSGAFLYPWMEIYARRA